MGELIQKLIYIIGGLARWFFANFMNIVFSKNKNSDIGFYIFEENKKTKDNSDFDSDKINFLVGILMIILFIIIITKSTKN